MPTLAKKTPAAAPALAKKTAKPAPAPAAPPVVDPAVNDIIVFGGYEKEVPEEQAFFVEGDFLRVIEIDATKKGRKRFHLQPITADEAGNARPIATAFAEELREATAEEQEEIATLLAQSDETEGGEEGEDYATLGANADAEDGDAQARLTELATEAGLDPEAYGTWTELADALATPDDDEDLLALGAAADDEDDEDAKNRLTELAAEHDVDTNAYQTWTEVARVLNGEELEPTAEAGEGEAEAEAPAPAAAPAKAPAKAGAKAPAPAAKAGAAAPAKKNAKKASTAPKAPKLALTPTMERMITECGNDLLKAMQTTEKEIGKNFLDLGGLIKLGEIQNLHQSDIDETTGKPRWEASKKGYYQYVAAYLDTEERVARHLAKIYQVFIAKLKYEPDGLIELGISRLREIAPIALKLNKLDVEANKAAGVKDANADNASKELETFLQDAAGLTVRDVVTKVRAIKAGPDAGGGTGGGVGGIADKKIVALTFRFFEDKAGFVKTCLEAAQSDLPDAEKNSENAMFRIFSEYAAGAGLPAYVAPKVKAPAAKAPVKAPAAPAKAAPAAKAPAPAAAPAPKAPAKKVAAVKK